MSSLPYSSLDRKIRWTEADHGVGQVAHYSSSTTSFVRTSHHQTLSGLFRPISLELLPRGDLRESGSSIVGVTHKLNPLRRHAFSQGYYSQNLFGPLQHLEGGYYFQPVQIFQRLLTTLFHHATAHLRIVMASSSPVREVNDLGLTAARASLASSPTPSTRRQEVSSHSPQLAACANVRVETPAQGFGFPAPQHPSEDKEPAKPTPIVFHSCRCERTRQPDFP